MCVFIWDVGGGPPKEHKQPKNTPIPARLQILILLILSNSSPPWGPSTHVHEPMGTILIQASTVSLDI